MRIIISVFFSLIVIGGFSQSLPNSKSAEKRKVKSIKVEKTEYTDGIETTNIETEASYDEGGNILEIKEWDSKGKIKLHEKYEYDSSGNKIKEINYDSKGKIIEYKEYKYKNKLQTERKEYYPNGKIKSVRKYNYSFYE
jgi:antitoxin component YwqK of YwqJK toxin-antitoxin module